MSWPNSNKAITTINELKGLITNFRSARDAKYFLNITITNNCYFLRANANLVKSYNY